MAKFPQISPRRSWLSVGVLAVLLGLSAELPSSEARAEQNGDKRKAPVTVAEVMNHAKAAQLENIVEIARKDLEAELSALDWGKTQSRRKFSISATVVELGSAPAGARTLLSSCVISATVHGERGDVLAVLQGKARAEDAASAATENERAVLAAAMRSAVARVPEAIAAAQ